MVAGAIAGNISAEATTPTGNTFAEAMRGCRRDLGAACFTRVLIVGESLRFRLFIDSFRSATIFPSGSYFSRDGNDRSQPFHRLARIGTGSVP